MIRTMNKQQILTLSNVCYTILPKITQTKMRTNLENECFHALHIAPYTEGKIEILLLLAHKNYS